MAKDNRKKAIEIMFTQFTPSEKQFKMLFCCSGSGVDVWVDTLIKKNYVFNDTQQSELAKIGYDTIKLYTNKTDLSIDALKTIIISVINGKSKHDALSCMITNNKIEYPPNFINWILSKFTPSTYNASYYLKNYKDILNIFLTQQNLKFDEDSYIHILNLKSCDFVYYCIDNGFVPTDESMHICATTTQLTELLFCFHNKFGLKLHVGIMNNLLKFGVNYIEKEHTTGHYYNRTKDPKQIESMLENFGYDKSLIEKASDNNFISCYKFFRLLNIIPNEETFELGCKVSNGDVINDCTKIFKMLPTNKHLQIMLGSYNLNLDLLNDILCYKILPTKEDLKILINNSSSGSRHQGIELLIKYGLVLDINDIAETLKNKIIIHDLDRFNIPYDETLYYYCYIYNCFPYDNKMEIDKNVLELRKMCRTTATTLDAFIKYVKTNNVMPDRYCYDHACYNNINILSHMTHLKCPPTLAKYYWLGLARNGFQHNEFKEYITLNNIDVEYMQTKYNVDFK